MNAPEATSAEAVRHLAEWVAQRLPVLNLEAQQRRRDAVAEIVRQGPERVDAIDIAHLAPMEPKKKAIIIGDIGMIVASALRHGVSVTDPCIAAMIGRAAHLSVGADHPPRDTVYTYVLWNGASGRPTRLFTGHHFEDEFISVSRSSLEQYAVAADACRDLDLVSDDAVPRLDAAIAAMSAIRAAYRSFFEKKSTAERPTWFRKIYKSYFPTYEIGGIEYDPPSGANSASILELDLVLGTVDDAYCTQMQRRLRHFISADRQKVEAALARPGVVQQLESDIAITPAVLTRLSSVIQLLARASAAHWALVSTYLVTSDSPADGATAESANVMSYADVFHILSLRRRNPVLQLIEQRMVSAPEGV